MAKHFLFAVGCVGGIEMPTISIITPWLNCPELIPTYERSVKGAEVIVVDNGSNDHTSAQLRLMIERLNGRYWRNDDNCRYTTANNQGMSVATGDILVFLNNDIEAPLGWLDAVANEVKDGALYGPRKMERMIAGQMLPYLEGFCIAGTRDTWERLNGWDAETYKGMYWEDNDVCFRALQMGMEIIETNWPVWHFGNYTSAHTDGAYDSSVTNYETFTERVRNAS